MSGELLDIEPDDIELELEPEPPTTTSAGGAPVLTLAVEAPSALMQVLPADFPLPNLTRFCPNLALRQAADEAAAYALGVEVAGPEGLQRADAAVTALRGTLKAIEEHFEEPVAIANRLHKQLTGVRGEWLERGAAAVRTIGSRIYAEQRRLDEIERETRRKAQDEADRQAREIARKQADEAAKAKAPEQIVEQMKKQAETATAPPVPVVAPAPKLQGVSTVTTWKARIAGTPACDEPLSDTEKLTPAQQLEVMKLLKAIIDGRAPMACICLNTAYLTRRAKADKGTLQIPGIEAYEEGGIRSKGMRAK
jgi:hypothetical protein